MPPARPYGSATAVRRKSSAAVAKRIETAAATPLSTKARASSVSRSARCIGSFVLGKTLGEGTFGEVKLAVHTPTNERVAAKVLEKSRIKTIADVKRVSREIRILKRVRHDNVIHLYEVLDTPNAIYFITESCDGGELFDYIVRHQRLLEPQAAFFFRQLVEGVSYLHTQDVTHRDLKPENLLLQSSRHGWRLKIIDFGLSNTHEGNRMLQTACGSPCYAAPEMIAGKRYHGPSADIWSMGVVLFTLVAGFLPFEDANTSALYKKILAGSYQVPRWVSADARDLLSIVLNTNPAARADMTQIRQHPWFCKADAMPQLPAAAPTNREDVRINIHLFYAMHNICVHYAVLHRFL
jgi:5'-AMP-activated protein kinase, catalytic alpha subunit